ncbi:MAG: branched-chain amino acid transport system ATP-binding protein [Clostridiales bacterium]|jgi:branched-chain amino acid transport system ATP-binding protein|nr:branched-chain amino acid transport system ATP-binding protein [Clostridiales bacterium]MDN5299354.1 branched-chain amino acid transport system ATP-binding protein [Clostridiales bacterium]
MLKIKNIHAAYGNIKAVKGIDIDVPSGKIVALLGSNGAGKTTTLKAISGLMPLETGTIELDEVPIHSMAPEKIAGLGIVQSPEGRQIFTSLTVEENLKVGAFTEKSRDVVDTRMKSVFGYFPRLEERRKQIAGTLSGGEQQMLAIGRALMANPKVLLLDEPSLGLAPLIVKDIFQIVKRLNDEGVTILIVEQNALQTLKIADYAYVMETGKIILEGAGNDLLQDEKVIEAYLGGNR